MHNSLLTWDNDHVQQAESVEKHGCVGAQWSDQARRYYMYESSINRVRPRSYL